MRSRTTGRRSGEFGGCAACSLTLLPCPFANTTDTQSQENHVCSLESRCAELAGGVDAELLQPSCHSLTSATLQPEWTTDYFLCWYGSRVGMRRS